MYVYEEIINGRKLTEIINETHENVKYLPGHKLPENVVSMQKRVKERAKVPQPNLIHVIFYTCVQYVVTIIRAHLTFG